MEQRNTSKYTTFHHQRPHRGSQTIGTVAFLSVSETRQSAQPLAAAITDVSVARSAPGHDAVSGSWTLCSQGARHAGLAVPREHI